MRTQKLAGRALITTALCGALVGLGTGVAEAKPKECRQLQARFDHVMAYTEANWQTMNQPEWNLYREVLGSTSDQMDALGC